MNARSGLAQGALLAVLALPVPQAVSADDDAVARTALEQRLRLTASLMADGNTSRRIMASGNQRALAHLDEGRVHHALAQDLLGEGDLSGARRSADEALKHLSMARRLVPDEPGRQAAARKRFDQMLASVERLIESLRQRLASTVRSDTEDGDLLAATGLLQAARGFGADGRVDDAVRALTAAERHVLTGINRLLHARTLDYTARAGTPAEEFELELARHRSLAELVPLAVNDLRPRADALALIDRYTEASTALRSQAQQRFAAGETRQALVHLHNALLYVQRALTSAGLVVPQAAGGTQ